MRISNLSQEDLSRINKCDNYKYVKAIMQSCDAYCNFKVGEVLLIKNTIHDAYVTGVTKLPTKFIIVHKDDGFIFAKRITSNGKLGVEIICLTIYYPSSDWSAEVDPDMCESIIMQSEDHYDPFKVNKDISKLRKKIKKINMDKFVRFDKPVDAHNYISKIKVNDIFHTCSSFLGDEAITWRVSSISTRNVDRSIRRDWGNVFVGASELDTFCIDCTIGEVIVLNLKAIDHDKDCPTWKLRDRELDIRDVISSKSSAHRKIYKDKPVDVRSEM
jgi:hypothetical protein